jgi:hypothetical protein
LSEPARVGDMLHQLRETVLKGHRPGSLRARRPRGRPWRRRTGRNGVSDMGNSRCGRHDDAPAKQDSATPAWRAGDARGHSRHGTAKRNCRSSPTSPRQRQPGRRSGGAAG